MSTGPDDAKHVNIAFWDALATAHGSEGDRYYDLDGLAAGASSLRFQEEAALDEALAGRALEGLDVLHVQCHLGLDAVTLARRGARVTGVDFSPVAVARARDIAVRCGVDVEYLEGDSTALPSSLHGRFDIAYATIGVLCWIADVQAWMTSVASTLRPGGKLVLVELHPVFQMVGSADPFVVDFPYAFDGARVFDEEQSYAGVDVGSGNGRNVNYAHALGEVVTAAVDAGLRVDALHEHLQCDFDPRGDVLTKEDDGRFRLRLGGEPLPVLFTLVASR